MRRLVEVVWKVGAGLALLVLTGCGGGGGGGNGGGTGVLTYFADFTPGAAGGPTGVSEVIQIKNSSGKVLGAKTVDNDGSGSARADFTGLPAGKLYLHGTLYSGTKGSGNATGTIDSVFQGASASVLTGKLGQPVSTVVISPSDTSVEVGAKQQFVASALDSNQDLVFEGPATWSVTAGGNFASITSAGLLTGVSLGQTTVQAAYGSVTGSLDVAITSKSGGTWTVMLFLNSANDLDFESPVNMAQIESIAQTATSQTRFVVQWKLSSSPTAQSGIYNHPWNGTRRYLAVHGGAQLIQ
ncbi:MAG TPA: Ig-like domain-containing protein, partial [Fimbriimonadaceae bacterium]|nr:Ig-like domain-containing protein [Fimbriimonadaceae bacterium]